MRSLPSRPPSASACASGPASVDVRTAELPSGLARVIVPNKVYVNRKRANGQVYPAAIEVRDVAWSVDTLLRAVEADLARRK